MIAPLDELLSAPTREEEAITRALLRRYRALRAKLFQHLAETHPDAPPDDRLAAAQTLLDRLLAVALARRRGLVPDGDPFGRSVLPPHGLDHLAPPDRASAELARLARLAVRDASSFEIVGHVFERSIGDLEALRSQGAARASRRHDQGIHYTPPRVARFLVDRTIGRILADRWQSILAARAPDRREGEARRRAWIDAWSAYREDLRRLRVLDPACGAGAFLVAAFEALAREHRRVDAALAELDAAPGDPLDLEENLHGVDLSPEPVEIARLSLWLASAARGPSPRYPARAVRSGDGLAEDLRGFDVVIGNPPYVRHELLAPIKDRLEASYAAYHGMADLLVYFFERGLAALAPGGRLGFVASNKWLRAEYGAPLRRLLASETRLDAILDLGHAPLFRGADTFPCIVTLQKHPAPPPDHAVRVTTFHPRPHQHDVPQGLLGGAPWNLEPPAVRALLDKIRRAGVPLIEYVGAKPFYGIKTGLNEAFLVDSATRDRLLAEEPRATTLLRRYLRGQDIARWTPAWKGLWIILLESSGDRAWAWTGLDEARAEARFAEIHPALYAHLKPLERSLRARADRGRYWWELRACAYYEAFARPKIVYQEIQFHPAYALDAEGMLLNNKCFFLPSADPWLLAVLNSPLVWWYAFRHLPHMKDETLSPTAAKMARLPIAPPPAAARAEAEDVVARLVEERAEGRALERRLAELVNEAYGLTPREVDRMWTTAPPRMPGAR